jgi:plasmid stability protein
MVDILIRNVPSELRAELKKSAAKSGLSVQQLAIKALEAYVESFKIDERLEQISNRSGISIDPAVIAEIINEGRNKRP